jgi:uncharacterized protein with PQ loop repeat
VTQHAASVAFGYLGSGFGVVMVLPQIIRVVRHPSLPGVSPLSWSLTALSCLAWLTYGLRTAAAPQVPGNILLISGAAAVVLLVPADLSRQRRALLLAACASAVLTAAWIVPAQWSGYLGFSVGLFSSWPQLYDSVGNLRARITSGVSVTTWALRIAAQLCWLTYAIGTTDVPVMISASVGLASSSALVVLESVARLSPRKLATGRLEAT